MFQKMRAHVELVAALGVALPVWTGFAARTVESLNGEWEFSFNGGDRFNWFSAIKKEDVVGKKVTVRFRPWSRDIDHTMKLKDADHMGSATKVIVLAP